MIIDRGKGILAALRSEQVRWEGEGLQSVYFIRHIASNFNKRFKNQDLKNRLLNMGNKFTLSFLILTCSFTTIFQIKQRYSPALSQLTRSNNLYSMQNCQHWDLIHLKWLLGTGYHYKSGLRHTMVVVDSVTWQQTWLNAWILF